MAPNAAMRPHLRIDPTLFKAVLKIGVPTGVQMIVISLAEVVLLSLVNGYGSQAIAAYGAVNQIVNYVQFPAISIAITCSILGAQAIGAGKPDRLGAIAEQAHDESRAHRNDGAGRLRVVACDYSTFHRRRSSGGHRAKLCACDALELPADGLSRRLVRHHARRQPR